MHPNRSALTAAAAGAVLLASACSDPGSSVSPALVEQLAARVQYLEDVTEIQKVQAKYVHYLFTQRFDRIFEETLAQQASDVSVEFSDSGAYRGIDSVRALYEAFEVTKGIPGFFILHMSVNPYIGRSSSRPTSSVIIPTCRRPTEALPTLGPPPPHAARGAFVAVFDQVC